MLNSNDDRYLSWFLGPKAENASVFLDGINTILQDYIHWRRNYYPSDPALITKKMQRDFITEHDKLNQSLMEMMSLLRRNFPFYSPRYIAHMLSDISLPSMLGYFAGMLYNANNVTPEASPVAVEWEIEACNEILKMLGFKPSPTPPQKDDPISTWENYQKELREEFGWAHITSGGTVANIEALWVARTVKYFPLAVKDIATQENITILIKRPNKTVDDIKKFSEKDIVNIKPNESIFLYAKLIEQLSKHYNISIEEASIRSAEMLADSIYSLTKGWGRILNEYPGVIFCSGAAHYSIKKAADIIGIGRDNVILVNTDSNFRMDPKDLDQKIRKAVNDNKVPLAVITVGATTEEGAVDPVKDIINLKSKYEEEGISFWLHIDGAWGGYFTSLFNFEEHDEFVFLLSKISKYFSFNVSHEGAIDQITLDFLDNLLGNILQFKEDELDPKFLKDNSTISEAELQALVNTIRSKTPSFEMAILNLKRLIQIQIDEAGKFDAKFKKNITAKLRHILSKYQHVYINYRVTDKEEERKFIRQPSDRLFHNNRSYILISQIFQPESNIVNITEEDINNETHKYVSETVKFSLNQFHEDKDLRWENAKVFESFLNFKNADSITIDPHKMGYVQYPCGVIAFRNDRVRHLIMQRAPYITSSTHSALIHNPPRHVKNLDFGRWKDILANREIAINSGGNQNKKKNKRKTVVNAEPLPLPFDEYSIGIDAFAPFMLEGSKPGAAAAALWLATKVIPLTRLNHGLIVKSSLLAVRELYEWLVSWPEITKIGISDDINYEFKTFGDYPDTNVLVFAIKDKTKQTIEGMNRLTKKVYDKFTIHAELGSRDHSYSQPFFLSKTTMDNAHYPFESFKNFFDSCELRNTKSDYNKHGLIILRATIMSPYLTPTRQFTNQNLIKEFVWELHMSAKEGLK